MNQIPEEDIRVVLNQICIKHPNLLVKIVFIDGKQPIGKVNKNGDESFTLEIAESDQHIIFTLDLVRELYTVG